MTVANGLVQVRQKLGLLGARQVRQEGSQATHCPSAFIIDPAGHTQVPLGRSRAEESHAVQAVGSPAIEQLAQE
ncbi:MAG: hypothetical protein P4L10_12350 [Acidobacteriaceae bacterium]|nr:hypothetical protein [Acidobacteriaceae bacterium]